jgi:hypothetical protein
MRKTTLRKRTNILRITKAAPRLLRLLAPEPRDYRSLSIAMSSAPLTGIIGEMRVVRDRREREARERGEVVERDRGRNGPCFDDLV